MKPAPTPANDESRLKTLQDYAILDTAPEPEYDALTQLASAICGTPIALISLVDRDRQWFKSKVGLGATETHRDISFCGHAILETETFVVQDATQDTRFADNPLVTGDPSIRFYAGAPLISENGDAIGTLCVIDSKPKDFPEEKRKALTTLSHMVMTQLELKKKNEKLAQALALIENQKQTLIHNAKMSALGEMAGGMAHEINNPLAIISGYATRVKHLLSSPSRAETQSKIDSSLEGISRGVERISSIIKGLQLFSRNSSQDPIQTADLRSIIDDSLELCREHLRLSNIELRYTSPKNEVSAQCRPSQISQILVNLINNARDAVKNTTEPKWISIEVEASPEGPKIKVSDSGPGVPEELQSKIFQPFFTTKSPGDGTGLGLSISSTLATANEATLAMTPGIGSSAFCIHFKMPKP